MKVPAHIVEYLKPREGWRDEVYLDTEGNPTVGMGHLLTTEQRATYDIGDRVPHNLLVIWAATDSTKAYSAALSQAEELGLARLTNFVTVLTSVNFQLGTQWRKKFPMTWEAMKNGKWASAVSMIGDSRWAAQTPSRAQDFIEVLNERERRSQAGQVAENIRDLEEAKTFKERRRIRTRVAVGLTIAVAAIVATVAATKANTEN
jgi:lysozyme